MFDAIAARYDLLNHILSLGLDRGWRKRAVDELAPTAGHRYLDVGTGTGDLAIELCLRAPGATVVGVDLAEGMLAAGRRKLRARGMAANCLVMQSDAHRLPFRDVSFRGVTSAFFIRNAEDRQRVLGEMHRVLDPSGVAVVLELTRPGNRFLRMGHGVHLRLAVPTIGRLLSRGDAYRYLARSIECFPAPRTIADEMGEAGFGDVRALPLSGGIVTLFSGQRS